MTDELIVRCPFEMFGNCSHVESARKEGAENVKCELCGKPRGGAWAYCEDCEEKHEKLAGLREADAKEKEIYEIILHISEGCPEEDCECQIIAEMLIPLMVRHEQRGAEARDAELLELIRKLPYLTRTSNGQTIGVIPVSELEKLFSLKPSEITPTYCKGCSFECQMTDCFCNCHDRKRILNDDSLNKIKKLLSPPKPEEKKKGICFNKLIKNQIKKIIACSVEEKGRATMVKLSDVLRIINEVS